MVVGTFTGESNLVELDTTRIISLAEQDEYSIIDYLQARLSALGWNLQVLPVSDGWPDYDEIATPGVYVETRERHVAGVELGSNGSRIIALVHIFGSNDAQRIRLAELVKNMFRDTIPIFSYETGNEDDPAATGEYFITDDVGWQRLPSAYTAPDAQKRRAIVTASLRRAE